MEKICEKVLAVNIAQKKGDKQILNLPMKDVTHTEGKINIYSEGNSIFACVLK
jgi:hypothetical protein